MPWKQTKTLEQRFWEKVEKTDGCWLWRAFIGNKGYGMFGLSRDGSKMLPNYRGSMIRSHRMAYLLCVGEIPKGLHVLHWCDNPSCVRPDHLFIGTNDDNIKDKVSKGRQARMFGIDHPRSKLTVAQADAIRQDKRIARVIGPEYGISASCVNQIRRGATWKVRE